jgi:hypothetical protein
MKEKIKIFVKQTLGCACPDEVFEHVECERDVRLNDNVLLNARINIGNRLLIFILNIDDEDCMKKNLTAVIVKGKKERDGRGFNRFRLVLAGENMSEFEQSAYTIFNDINMGDEKMHLHVVEKKNLIS